MAAVGPVGAWTSPKIAPERSAAGHSDQRVRRPAKKKPRKKISSAIGASTTIAVTAKIAMPIPGLQTPSSLPMSSCFGCRTIAEKMIAPR